MNTELENNPKITDADVVKKYISLQHSAASRNTPFSLSFNHVKKLLLASKCYYTGVEFTKSGDYARSVDQIDPGRGYTDENTVPCTVKVNRIKDNFTFEELSNVVAKLSKFKKARLTKEYNKKLKKFSV
jgi:hypothetical protein